MDGCANLAVAELRFRRPILYCGLYTKPAAQNLLQQQAKFDRFIECYNHARPHQALKVGRNGRRHSRVNLAGVTEDLHYSNDPK